MAALPSLLPLGKEYTIPPLSLAGVDGAEGRTICAVSTATMITSYSSSTNVYGVLVSLHYSPQHLPCL